MEAGFICDGVNEEVMQYQQWYRPKIFFPEILAAASRRLFSETTDVNTCCALQQAAVLVLAAGDVERLL